MNADVERIIVGLLEQAADINTSDEDYRKIVARVEYLRRLLPPQE